MSYRLYHLASRGARLTGARASGAVAARVLASGLAALAIVLSTVSPVAAHEGDLEYVGRSGPLFVEVVDEVIEDAGLLYTITLRDPVTGLPADELEVTIVARSGDTVVGPLGTNRFANAYQTFIPDDGRETWTITVEVGTERGIITAFEHELRGVGTTGPRWWVPALAATIVGAGTYAVARTIEARRSRTPSTPGADLGMQVAVDGARPSPNHVRDEPATTVQPESTRGPRDGWPISE